MLLTCPGWLNLLLKYMWPGFISNIATNLTVSQLNNLFERLSRMLAGMPIFRVVFSKMVLRELSLGATPPSFANGTVRIALYDLELLYLRPSVSPGFHLAGPVNAALHGHSPVPTTKPADLALFCVDHRVGSSMHPQASCRELRNRHTMISVHCCAQLTTASATWPHTGIGMTGPASRSPDRPVAALHPSVSRISK